MPKKFLYLFYIVIWCAALIPKKVEATHLRAGEIVVLRENCTSLTFKIIINVYTDTGSQVRFGEGLLDCGDGHIVNTPIIENSSRQDLGAEVGTVSYVYIHTYSGPGRYVISYREPNRNEGVLNMFGSVNTQFYIETVINIDPILGCNNSPQLLVPPIDKACPGVAWFHNPGAYDLDGDSISFELVTPKQNRGQDVNDYLPLNNRKFYDLIGIDYERANETNNAPPGFAINATTGTVTWDAPGAIGEYNIAILIKEWRKIQNTWVLMGSVIRDMQIIVEDCRNRRPELTIPEDICVETGTKIEKSIFGSDPDIDNVKIEAYSSVFNLLSSPAQYSPNPPVFQSTRVGRAEQKFTWNTGCEHVKIQPYQVIFKITDKPDRGLGLVAFKTWNITIVASAPTWNNVTLGTTSNSANLTWNTYPCANAQKIQIWRREGNFDATPSICTVGMPPSWGYTQIGEVPINKTSFTDTNNGEGLTPGITYCYRIVAEFPAPKGGKSYVSANRCITIKADKPIPTKVTVDITDTEKGQTTIAWRSPFDIDTTKFPPPYKFKVYRGEGFSNTSQRTTIHPGVLSDSTFIDRNLNTQEKIYNYDIVAFDKNDTEVGRSVTASSVQLTLNPQLGQIILMWKAQVPWSNNAQQHPWHLVYRGPAKATREQMVLIDSIDTNKQPFNYTDAGQFNGIPLSPNEKYCYSVMTRGTYSNPKIAEPLENFSQITCAQPNDITPPCRPTISLNLPNAPCETYRASVPCAVSTFSNKLTWLPPSDTVCREDIEGYNIYVARRRGEKFVLYKRNHKGIEFNDENLPSFARCYKISAVDQAGNESTLSDSVCFDNCPYYELPNVFTPNGDPCNQTFSAFSDRIVLNENGKAPCGQADEALIRQRCARFVEKVKIVLVNRWGKTVYTYESGGEKSIFIDWDGKDQFGSELSEGIFFYNAEVLFDVVDPEKRKKTIKGWVHLIR